MNVSGYALFSNPNRPFFGAYWNSALLTLRAHLAHFPGWRFRLYHDERLLDHRTGRALADLADTGVLDLVQFEPYQTLARSQAWRLLPFWDKSVDAFISRDMDSLECGRSRRCVYEWMESTWLAHSIIGCDTHAGIRYLGGLVGFKRAASERVRSIYRDFDALCKDYPLHGYGDDELLMRDRLWPILGRLTLVHCFSDLRTTWMLSAGELRVGVGSAAVPGVDSGVLTASDALAPEYIGYAGINNPQRIFELYEAHGPAAEMKKIREAEQRHGIVPAELECVRS